LADTVANRMELAMPPGVTAEMAKGLTLYMLRAIMGGRGDEMVVLARTNLRRWVHDSARRYDSIKMTEPYVATTNQ
jgi:hypothetical protein